MAELRTKQIEEVLMDMNCNSVIPYHQHDASDAKELLEDFLLTLSFEQVQHMFKKRVR